MNNRPESYFKLTYYSVFRNFGTLPLEVAERNFDKVAFTKLLSATPLKYYTDELWGIGCSLHAYKINKEISGIYSIKKREEISKNLELLRMFKMFDELNKENCELKLSAYGINDNNKITSRFNNLGSFINKKILTPIIESLELNRICMDYTTAIYLYNRDCQTQKKAGVYDKHKFTSDIKAVKKYIFDNSIILDINTPSSVDKMIEYWEDREKIFKKNVGREKDYWLNSYLLELIYLIKCSVIPFNISKQEIKEELSKFPSNKMFSWVFDYFDFFNLLDSLNKSGYQLLKTRYKSSQKAVAKEGHEIKINTLVESIIILKNSNKKELDQLHKEISALIG